MMSEEDAIMDLSGASIVDVTYVQLPPIFQSSLKTQESYLRSILTTMQGEGWIILRVDIINFDVAMIERKRGG